MRTLTRKSIALFAVALILLLLAPMPVKAVDLNDLFPPKPIGLTTVDLTPSLSDIAEIATAGTAYSGSGTITVTLKQGAPDRIVFSIGYKEIGRYLMYGFGPGAYVTMDFKIDNQTGAVYKVADYYFDSSLSGTRRTYNAAARDYFKTPGYGSKLQLDALAKLDPDVWWEINKQFYFDSDTSKYTELAILRRMTGSGGGEIAGNATYEDETSPEMAALNEYYLYHNVRLTFDNVNYPLPSGSSTLGTCLDISLYDYLYKTAANEARVLGDFFAEEIDENGFASEMKYKVDGDCVGNAYNAMIHNIEFVFVLERIGPDPTPTPTPSPVPDVPLVMIPAFNPTPTPSPSPTPEPSPEPTERVYEEYDVPLGDNPPIVETNDRARNYIVWALVAVMAVAVGVAAVRRRRLSKR